MYLIQSELSWLGFSIAYDEVHTYKQSVIQSVSLENLLMGYPQGQIMLITM